MFLPSMGGGGAERVMLHLARGFVDRGFDVDLVLSKAVGPYLAEIPPGVCVVDLGASRVVASLARLVRYLRRERPQVMLSALSHANVVALLAQRIARTGTRIVVSEHAAASHSASHATNQRDRWMPWFMRFTYPWADRVVSVSEGVAIDLARAINLPRKRIDVIYNPVVTPELLEKAAQPLQHPWFAPHQPAVIIGMGRLAAQKDFSTLLRAFGKVCKTRSARLMILGEGEERAKLLALIRELGLAEDVALPGFVANPFQYLKRARLFVLSSCWEGFGNALAEAMACGTTVVSTDCASGPAEILEGGKWGRLVPVGDVDALALAIEGALDIPGCDPRERGNYFCLGRAVDSYLDVLDLPRTALATYVTSEAV
jgi:glycosyltransferase involved in cell wall biosynthesis